MCVQDGWILQTRSRKKTLTSIQGIRSYLKSCEMTSNDRVLLVVGIVKLKLKCDRLLLIDIMILIINHLS